MLSLGIAFSLISLGKLLDFLFAQYPVYVWAFFFGLIAISIVSVGRTIRQWNAVTWTWFVIGTGLAVWLSFLKPAGQNDHTLYLVLCGTVAMASMILPGLSGSFVLILMGNYRLVMLEAVPSLNMTVLLPVVGGALIGFVLLSRIINYLLKFRHDQTIATLTGFILGSLLIIWPWKNEILLTDPETGTAIIRDGQEVVQGYEWFLPQMSIQTGIAAAFILIGIAIVLAIEHISRQQ